MITLAHNLNEMQRDSFSGLVPDTSMHDAVQMAKANHCRIVYDENKRVFTVKPKSLGHTLEELFK